MPSPEPTPVNLPPLTIKNSPNQSARTDYPGGVRLVVVHEPVGGYEGTVAYIMRPGSNVSYHVLTSEDCKEATQLVPWGRKAWSCARFNSVSDNISIAGKPENWSFAALNRLARIVAYRLKERDLPATFYSAPLRPPPVGTARGFTYHSQLGAAGGGHSDPRFSRTQSAFFKLAVKFHRRIGGFRPQWGRD